MAEERMLITGGQRLEGTVRVSGGKNTSVAVISASILSETPCVIENLPNIEDVNVSVETLRHLGAKVNWDPDAGVMEVDSSTIDRTDVPLELCRRMRASSYYIGALLARFGRAQVPLPGGCDIGRRPIDQHIKGMRALGAKVETTRGLVVAQTDGLIGSDVFMDMVTVGGTINVMLAACRADFEKTGRRVSFEYTMIDGVSDSPEQAQLLAKKLAGMGAHVNMIPLNNVTESGLHTSSKQAIHRFQTILEENGITATLRRTLGSDIDASCGQLRRKYESN